ncbi:hypothetical protein lerEdw1_016404 [Lerista edwardsae]|nr:hypothetical protein lerEdw1_016404 [Lerista edwardsae]
MDLCDQYPDHKSGVCFRISDPVCGSDGQTYDNKCLFCEARWNNSKLTIKHEGECEQKDECAQYPEPAKGNVAVCSRMCSPVCGSDGQTYDTRCHFCAAKCYKTSLSCIFAGKIASSQSSRKIDVSKRANDGKFHGNPGNLSTKESH